MNFGELLWWYLGNVRDYATQMLPCMCAAAAVYALALPARRRRLDRLWLVSPLRREIALKKLTKAQKEALCAGWTAEKDE